MTAEEHRREAEKFLAVVRDGIEAGAAAAGKDPTEMAEGMIRAAPVTAVAVAQAQVHATLAHAQYARNIEERLADIAAILHDRLPR